MRRVFGKTVEVKTTRKGRRDRVVNNEDRRVTEILAADCYHGGLNTAYRVGHVECDAKSVVLDIDLAGAYSAALGGMGGVLWAGIPRFITKSEQLQKLFTSKAIDSAGCVPNVLGLVEYEFPETELYPCLPLRTDGGLLYCLRGTTYATGIEMELALRMGATLRFKEVRYFQSAIVDGEVYLPFADYIGMLNRERKVSGKGSLDDMLYKELANSLYGKLAQGIRYQTKREYHGDYDELTRTSHLPESDVDLPTLRRDVYSDHQGGAIGDRVGAIEVRRIYDSVRDDRWMYVGGSKKVRS
jgi:hypothetical protein